MDKFDTGKVLYDKDDHKVIWLGWDEDENGEAVQTNQYLVIHKGKGTLVDPGGVHLFSRVVAVISNYINIENIENIFFSHQDPDVSSGIALWLGVTRAKIYISKLWIRFMPHFGIIDQKRMIAVPDKGGELPIGDGMKLDLIPAHFLHSPGNFAAWDETAGILFTSDIGAAVFEPKNKYLFVENFQEHLKIMEGFHKRYMSSNQACRNFVQKLTDKTIHIVAPQHGALFRDDLVDRFLTWLENLRCGVDVIESFEK